MSKLEKALSIIRRSETGRSALQSPVSVLALTLSIIGFIIVTLIISVYDIQRILLMGVWLVIAAPWLGVSYYNLFIRSIYILPFILLIGIFNPIIDHSKAIIVHSICITKGWLSFVGIVLRGLLCVQALMLLVEVYGFQGLCRGLSKLGIPNFLIRQLLFVYRYIKVLLEEALTMKMARQSRGYGKEKMNLKMWGVLIGQLFIRSINRAERIHRAMLSRGFAGEIPIFLFKEQQWNYKDTIWMTIAGVYFTFVLIWRF